MNQWLCQKQCKTENCQLTINVHPCWYPPKLCLYCQHLTSKHKLCFIFTSLKNRRQHFMNIKLHTSPITIVNNLKKKRTPDHSGHKHTYLASDSSSLTRLCASSNILSVAVFCSESFSFLLSILFSVWRRLYFSLSAGGRDSNSKSSSPAGQNNKKWWDQKDAKIDFNLPTCFFFAQLTKEC